MLPIQRILTKARSTLQPGPVILGALLLVTVANVVDFFAVDHRAGVWAAVHFWKGTRFFELPLVSQRYKCHFELGDVAPGITLVAPKKWDSWDLTRDEGFATYALGIGRAKEFERREYDPRIRMREAKYRPYIVSETKLYIGKRLGVPAEEIQSNMRQCRILLKDDDPDVLYCMTPSSHEIWLVDERLLLNSNVLQAASR